jgi:hypothetical protein
MYALIAVSVEKVQMQASSGGGFAKNLNRSEEHKVMAHNIPHFGAGSVIALTKLGVMQRSDLQK